jgi:hypothetical protein
MLDLDRLAQTRAKICKEKVEPWHQALWSQPFQLWSKNMTDSEVESIVASCPSVAHLLAIIAHLSKNSRRVAGAPYLFLQAEARQAKMGFIDWVSALVKVTSSGS